MIFNIIGALIGAAVTVGGIYYLVKEKDDEESKKIYSAVSLIGALLFIFTVVRLIVQL